MNKITQWYPSFADKTFPTVFLQLSAEEKALLVGEHHDSNVKSNLVKRINKSIHALPGSCFVATDSCAPTDSEFFAKLKPCSNGENAIKLLTSSNKVKVALSSEDCQHLTIRPYRRMDKTREFRLFVYGGELVSMSQYCLERHFRRLEGHKQTFWEKAREFFTELKPFLTDTEAVIDVYLCSDGTFLIVDFNTWGEPTQPLLMRKWDRDWSENQGIRLIKPPMKMKGDVKVSF